VSVRKLVISKIPEALRGLYKLLIEAMSVKALVHMLEPLLVVLLEPMSAEVLLQSVKVMVKSLSLVPL